MNFDDYVTMMFRLINSQEYRSFEIGGGGGGTRPHFGRYVPRQIEKWGGGGVPRERFERENAGLWSGLEREILSTWSLTVHTHHCTVKSRN